MQAPWPAARSGGAAAPAGRRRPMPAAAACRARCLSFLKYTQTQESSADQAAMTFLERTHQSPKGAVEFLRILQREERMAIGRQRSVSHDPSADARAHRGVRAGGRALPLRQRARSAAVSRNAPSHRGEADGLPLAVDGAAALRRRRPIGAGALCPRGRALPHRRARLGAAHDRRAAEGLSQRSVLPRAARPDAVRQWPRQRSGAVIPPRGPAPARESASSRSISRAP